MEKVGSEFDLADICRELNKRMGCDANHARQIIEEFFGVVAEVLPAENRVEIHGAGVFHLHLVPGHNHYNLATGEVEPLPDTWHMTFKASPGIRKLVADTIGDGNRVH